MTTKPKRRLFAEELNKLYEAAGGRQLGHQRLVSLGKQHGIEVTAKRLSAWMAAAGDRGPETPGSKYTKYIELLTNFLEELAEQRNPHHRGRSRDGWTDLLSEAQKEGSAHRGGRPHKSGSMTRCSAPEPEFSLPGHQNLARTVLPPKGVKDREDELAELAAFAADRSRAARPYTWWQAGPWTGKSALLSWFLLEERPVDVDAVGYFIANRFDNNDRESFLNSVNRQLAAVAGQKISAARRRTPELFHELLPAAAAVAGSRGRTLLLAVDGLDEDEGARPGGRSIAALLPPNPPPNLRVVVTSRPNPGVPQDVLPGSHPLRDPSIVRQLADVPAATAARDTAVHELARLLDDRPVGIGIVGLLAAARGGLRGSDLAELLGKIPYDIDKLLRSVTGRSLAFDHTVLSSDRAYVLGHDELLKAAVDQLGDLARYEQTLHDWADDYCGRGWPGNTPPYLLHHYTSLLQRTGDTARLTACALDAKRQQRLLATASADIALGDLDRAADTVTGDSPADLEVLAAVAASRDLVSAAARPMPRAIPRAFALLGDISRARSLALAFPGPAGRAHALADIARALAAPGAKEAQTQARDLAGDAEFWMRTALREADPRDEGIYEAESAAEVACALVESGQQQKAAALLKAASCDAWDFINAATACLPLDSELSRKLLDEAEQRAEHTHPRHGRPDDPEAAVRVWVEIIRAAPDRAERVCDLIHDYATGRATGPGQRAAASTALAGYRPETAAALAEQARAEVAAMLQAPGGIDSDPYFLDTLALVVQALTDTGRPADAEKLRADVPEETLTDPLKLDFDFDFDNFLIGDEDSDPSEPDAAPSAADLAQEAIELAEQGKNQEAWERLEAALRRHASGASRRGNRVRWLALLAGALAVGGDFDTDEDADQLIGLLDNSADQARAYASASLASAEAGRSASAIRLARAAARAAETLRESAVAERILVAQALAHAGDRQAAFGLLSRTDLSGPGRAQRARQRRELYLGQLAVLAGLRHHVPAAVARHIDKTRKKITESLGHDRSTLVSALAELLPLVPDSEPGCRTRILEAIQAAGPPPSEQPDQWSPKSHLIWVLLQPTVTREERDSESAQLTMPSLYAGDGDPYEIAQAGLALVQAALGSLDHAQRLADGIGLPELRAGTYTAVAGHLARVPAHLPTNYKRFMFTLHPDMPLLRALALTRHPDHATPAEGDTCTCAARFFVRKALTTGDSWCQALPVLACLAPAAVRRIRGLAFTHLGGPGISGGVRRSVEGVRFR
ncbi:hypothetical protein [Streptomyces sp. NPDC048295]|uniref:hypothetical protein n=1 Tax=Streptomyces sp. NPDC048295 TaxID=3154617 RepID=UPI00341DAA45